MMFAVMVYNRVCSLEILVRKLSQQVVSLHRQVLDGGCNTMNPVQMMDSFDSVFDHLLSLILCIYVRAVNRCLIG